MLHSVNLKINVGLDTRTSSRMRGSLEADLLHATMHIMPKTHDVHKLPKHLA